MNRPYISVETILEQFRSIAEGNRDQPSTAGTLQSLAEFLAREHATMNADDWDVIVRVGALLWQTKEAWDGTPRMR